MLNSQKYKTVEERANAFEATCAVTKIKHQCEDALSCVECQFAWLELEAEEKKILPCPFCGSRCIAIDGSKIAPDRHGVRPYSYVKCESCGYESIATDDYDNSGIEDIIDAHNRVARAVMEKEERRR